MDNLKSLFDSRIRTIRWIARIYSVLVILLFGIFFIIELTGRIGLTSPPAGGLPPLSTADAIQFYSMGVMLIGLGMAWRWEMVGGSITLIPAIIDGVINPRAFIVVILIVAPAIVFLLCWWWTRSFRLTENRMAETNSTAPPPTNA